MNFEQQKRTEQILKIVRPWILPGLLISLVIATAIGSAQFYRKTESEYFEAQSKLLADRIASSLTNEIHHRVAMLQIMSTNGASFNAKEHEQMAEGVIKAYPDYFTINMINTKGVIAQVYPKVLNRPALGQNLLQRRDIRQYLIDARDKKMAQMSHKIMTYQGIPAFVLYVPVFNSAGTFLGWLNAGVDFDTWLDNFLKVNKLETVRVMVQWEHAGSGVVDRGNVSPEMMYRFSHHILNQKLTLSVGFAPNHLEMVRDRSYLIVTLVGAALLIIALIFVILYNISRLRLNRINQSLATNNSLLTSLSHDLSSPLSALGIVLHPQLDNSVNVISTWQKDMISQLLKNMKEMLKNVKMLHAQGAADLHIDTHPVLIASAVKEGVAIVTAIADQKSVYFEVQPIPEDLRVQAEPGILVNNVLLNVFTNAIKFSPIGGKILVYSKEEPTVVKLIVEDEGKGFSDEQLEKIKKSENLPSTVGTKGELGSGLGLFQIRFFMKAFGGLVRISNREKKNGSKISLLFNP